MGKNENIELKHIKFDNWPYEALEVNMPVVRLCELLGKYDNGVYRVLQERAGVKPSAPLLLHQEDIDWYKGVIKKEQHRSKGVCKPWTEKDSDIHKMINLLLNCIYFEERFTDFETGKIGLMSSTGVITVPPVFDDCEPIHDLDFVLTLATVKLKNKYWLTPRDGSGTITKSLYFDSVSTSYCYGLVSRDNKYGFINSQTGTFHIPCKMDWIEKIDGGFVLLVGQDFKIGWADTVTPEKVDFIKPQFDAIDLTTRRLCKGGKWGWLLKNGRFTVKPPLKQKDCMSLSWELSTYLDTKPRELEDEGYLTVEEMMKSIDEDIKKQMDELKFPPEHFLHLPNEGFENIPDINTGTLIEEIEGWVKQELQDKSPFPLLFTTSTPPELEGTHECPTMAVDLKDGMIHVGWGLRNRSVAWYETRFSLLGKCHVLIQPGDDSFCIRMSKTFPITDVVQVARFIAIYFKEVWNIDADSISPLDLPPLSLLDPDFDISSEDWDESDLDFPSDIP